MQRTLPNDRCTLAEFLAITRMSKATFFPRYRHAANYAQLLDPQYDRKLRVLHVKRAAAHHIAAERAHKMTHGNKGRAPQRVCANCSGTASPRHRDCPHCGAALPQRSDRGRRELVGVAG